MVQHKSNLFSSEGNEVKLNEHVPVLSGCSSSSCDLRPFSCKICKKSFKNKRQLNAHMVVHTDIRPFSCQICGKRFKRRSYLTRHIDVHSIIYVCGVCGKKFKH